MRRILTLTAILSIFFIGVLPSFSADLYTSGTLFTDYPNPSRQGSVERYESTNGTFQGKFASGEAPYSLAFAPDGTLYVGYLGGSSASTPSGYIERFNPLTGQSLGILLGTNDFIAPNRMTFGSDGDLYFSSYLSSVEKVDPTTGERLASYAVNSPFGITTQGNTLFVAGFVQVGQSGDYGIQKFNTLTGQYDGLFARSDSYRFTSLAFAPNGNLFGSDTAAERISVFSPSGSLVNQFSVNLPLGLTFGEDGDLYVVSSLFQGSSSNQLINRYSVDGTFLGTVATLNSTLSYSDVAFGPSVSVPEPSPIFTTLLIGGTAIGLAWKKQRKKNA